MKLEDQVCTPEQGEILKGLGIIQESLFYWPHSEKWGILPRSSIDFKGNPTSVFTVSEIAVMLPDYYPSWRFKVNEATEERRWVSTVICAPKPPGIDDIHTAPAFDRYGTTQAISLAKLLISLLETGTILPEECNKRLADT